MDFNMHFITKYLSMYFVSMYVFYSKICIIKCILVSQKFRTWRVIMAPSTQKLLQIRLEPPESQSRQCWDRLLDWRGCIQESCPVSRRTPRSTTEPPSLPSFLGIPKSALEGWGGTPNRFWGNTWGKENEGQLHSTLLDTTYCLVVT